MTGVCVNVIGEMIQFTCISIDSNVTTNMKRCYVDKTTLFVARLSTTRRGVLHKT